jgi:transcriptional regulator with XRE-family HTH domain
MGTVERGESNLSFHNLVKVATALGITVSQLVSGIEKRAEDLTKQPTESKAKR